MLLAGTLLWLAAHVLDIDFFERFLDGIATLGHDLEDFEADELILVALLVWIGLLTDWVISLRRVRKQKEIEAERLAALKMTVRTVQDIVGNFLNQLQLFTYEAEKTKGLKPESIQRINALIFTTADRLRALEAMDRLTKRQMGDLTVVETRVGEKQGGTLRAAEPESRKETPTAPEGKGG
jgi:hypothetical protein